MTVLAVMLVSVTLLTDLVSAINKSRVINRNAIRRLSILLPIVIILFSISDDTRIRFTYRSNPEFIRYYEDNIEKFPTFFDLRRAYNSTVGW